VGAVISIALWHLILPCGHGYKMKPPLQKPARNQGMILLCVTAMAVAGCPLLCILLNLLPSDQSKWYVAAAVLPFVFLILLTFADLRRQQTRSTEGRCTNCGYDLRATPDRCPECGRAAKATTTRDPAGKGG